MDDAAFVDAFEDLSLPPAAFDHRGHLRLALLTLARDGFEVTAVRLPQAIQRYATHLGAPEKFHATLTHALLQLLEAERSAQGTQRTWEALLMKRFRTVLPAPLPACGLKLSAALLRHPLGTACPAPNF